MSHGQTGKQSWRGASLAAIRVSFEAWDIRGLRSWRNGATIKVARIVESVGVDDIGSQPELTVITGGMGRGGGVGGMIIAGTTGVTR